MLVRGFYQTAALDKALQSCPPRVCSHISDDQLLCSSNTPALL